MEVVAEPKVKYTFSGHETFQCRHLWLKKGYEFVKAKRSFNDEDAVLILGAGKNMVASIRFWMKAFGIIRNNDQLTEFGHKLLSNEGWDPYLEDEASLWLLHYHLVTNNIASSYFLFFNELRKEKIEFTKENFISFVIRKSEATGDFLANRNTLETDFNVLTKMYLRSDTQSKDKEDTFSGILTELDLIKGKGKRDDIDGKKGEELYIVENTEKTEIPENIILYSILNNGGFESSINLLKIEQDINSAGSVFAINRSGILSKIEALTKKYKSQIVFNDTAGIREIQFKKPMDKFKCLEDYYNNGK